MFVQRALKYTGIPSKSHSGHVGGVAFFYLPKDQSHMNSHCGISSHEKTASIRSSSIRCFQTISMQNTKNCYAFRTVLCIAIKVILFLDKRTVTYNCLLQLYQPYRLLGAFRARFEIQGINANSKIYCYLDHPLNFIPNKKGISPA